MIKAGLNIGNSKLSCVVCDYQSSKKLKILSLVDIPTKDIKKNIVISYNNLLEETKKLILDSEKNSQTKLNSINVNVTATESISEYFDSEIIINDEKINELHLKKAINQSSYFKKVENYYDSINNIIAYELDKKFLYSEPIGNYANKVKIYFYKLLLNMKYINNIKNLTKDLKLHIENLIPSPISSALSTLSEDEKNLGSICIDLGHSTTSTAIFENNNFIFGDSFLVGSNNITNDIARGVSTTIASAERLKTLYGSVISSPSDEHEIIEIPLISGESNQFNQINRSTVNSIIKPRVEETLEIVWQKIKHNNLHNKKIKNVVLTGGGAQLEGIAEYAKIIFSSNVRLGKPLDYLNIEKNISKANFADIIGTVLFEPKNHSIKYINKESNSKKNLGFSGFFSWLDQYI
tara:strand:+ start:1554 stop:2774 length:1221 start_codon:yes stop_codon:yes gene_type:complete